MHVVHTFEPGGMELGVVKLMNGLDPAKVRSAVCSTRPAGRLTRLIPSRVPVFELPRNDGNDPRVVWSLYRLFRRERPDIVHTHAWGTLLEGLCAARMSRVPAVVHGEHGTLQLRPHQRWLQRRGWSNVEQVLSVSTRLAERMAGQVGFPLARIGVIRNGVDLMRFAGTARSGARAALDLDADALVVGAVGRLVPVKDHASLVEAAALLRRHGLAPTIVIAGDGPLHDMLLSRAVALGIESQIRLLGDRPDIETVLAALDVFALTSVSEGLSNTILEAMAAGLPVVATEVGGADELVERDVTGVLVPARSPSALASSLALLLRDPAMRAAMGAAGRQRAEREFSLGGMVRQYENLYLSLARRVAPGALERPVRAS
jgi:sugar transferase (PEP-CTERM/EpsH1 system associated)